MAVQGVQRPSDGIQPQGNERPRRKEAPRGNAAEGTRNLRALGVPLYGHSAGRRGRSARNRRACTVGGRARPGNAGHRYRPGMGTHVHGGSHAGHPTTLRSPELSARRHSMKTTFVLTSLIVLSGIAALTSCGDAVHAAPDDGAVPVQVRTPAVVERAESVSASGSVE